MRRDRPDDVMAAVEPDGQLVIADVSAEESWLSTAGADAVALEEWR